MKPNTHIQQQYETVIPKGLSTRQTIINIGLSKINIKQVQRICGNFSSNNPKIMDEDTSINKQSNSHGSYSTACQRGLIILDNF